jgi:hypothetical protein
MSAAGVSGGIGGWAGWITAVLETAVFAAAGRGVIGPTDTFGTEFCCAAVPLGIGPRVARFGAEDPGEAPAAALGPRDPGSVVSAVARAVSGPAPTAIPSRIVAAPR